MSSQYKPQIKWHLSLLLGALVGAVAGGGLLALLWPSEWPIPAHAWYWWQIAQGNSAATHAYMGALAASGAELALAWRLAAAVGAALGAGGLVGYALWWQQCLADPDPHVRHVSGSRLLAWRPTAERMARRLSRRERRDPEAIEIHPMVSFGIDRQRQGLGVVGGPGSGKTVLLTPLIQRVLDSGASALIWDSKKDFTARLRGGASGIVLIAPWDRRSAAWDIAADVLDETDAQLVAESVIPPTDQPIWSQGARGLLTGLLVSLGRVHGREWGWKELADALALAPADMHAVLNAHYPAAAAFADPESETAASMIINLQASMGWVSLLATAWPASEKRRRWSVRRWIAGGGRRAVILQGSSRYVMGQYVAGGIINLAASLLLDLPDSRGRSTWFLFDEFAALPHIGSLGPLLERGRSKGARVVLGLQDVQQIVRRYGRETVDAWMSMIRSWIVMQCSSMGPTADYLSAGLEEREIDRLHVNRSSDSDTESRAWHRERVRVVPAHQISGLEAPAAPFGAPGYLKVAGWPWVFKLWWKFSSEKDQQPANKPAAWAEPDVGGAAAAAPLVVAAVTAPAAPAPAEPSTPATPEPADPAADLQPEAEDRKRQAVPLTQMIAALAAAPEAAANLQPQPEPAELGDDAETAGEDDSDGSAEAEALFGSASGAYTDPDDPFGGGSEQQESEAEPAEPGLDPDAAAEILRALRGEIEDEETQQ